MNEFVLYILYSAKHNKSYVGITTNLIERFKNHQILGKGYTAKYRPWIVVHVEVFDNKKEAMAAEKYFLNFPAYNSDVVCLRI